MPRPFSVVGSVLAAGWSRRMGFPKALLRCGPAGETFVERLARTVDRAGTDGVLVVGRPDDAALRAAVASLGPIARFVENPHAERGQLSSILAVIDEVERTGGEGVLVMPVDIPLVRVETIVAALDAFHATGAPIVRVTHGGHHGHPVIFGAPVFDELRTADISIGAKAVLRSNAGRVCNLEVDDPAVLRDVDTAADYRALFGRDPDQP